MKQAVLFFNRPYIEAHFCFKEMAVQFAKRNYNVYLFYIRNDQIPDFKKHPNVKTYPFTLSKWSLVKVMFKLLTLKCEVIVATPQWSFYWASKLKKIKSFKLVYLSDEVYANNQKEYSRAQKQQPLATQKKWKNREIKAHQLCDATIALGRERYNLLKQINNIPDAHPYFIIPNAPSKKKLNAKFKSYYREKLGLKNTDIVLLHSGGLGWSLIQHVNDLKLPENVKIVLQTRKKFPDFFSLSPNVIVNDDFISYENIVSATSSAHIGLLLYDEKNPEEKRNGNTAGKLGLYLAAGLPVIAGNLKIFNWLCDKEIGVRINDLSELVDATNKIMRNYTHYKKNVSNTFNKDFEYSRKFGLFENWINNNNKT